MAAEARILLITSRFPYPPISGERLRAYHLVRQLSRRFAVSVIALDPGDPAAAGGLRQATGCAAVEVVRPSRAERLRGLAGAILRGDPLQVGYFRSEALRAAIRRQAPFHDLAIFHLIRRSDDWQAAADLPRVLEMCDAISENFRQTAAHGRWWSPWTWVSALEAPRTARYERRILRHFDLVSTVTVPDAVRLGIPEGQRLVSTNGVELGSRPPGAASARHGAAIALIGKMDYFPNRDAARWFAREVLPGLPPPIHLKVIGDCSAKLRRELEALPRVVVTGRVPSIAGACGDCFCAAAPIQVATGIQNKVLDSFAIGLPTVMSPSVAGGLLPEAAGCYLVARSPAEWVEAIGRLRSGGPTVDALARDARHYVETSHDWDRIGDAYCAALRRLLEAPRRSAGAAPEE